MYPERNGAEDREVCRQLIEAHRQWMVSGDDNATNEDSCIRPSQIGSWRSMSTNRDGTFGTTSSGKQSEYNRAVATGLLPSSQSNLDADQKSSESTPAASAGNKKTNADELVSIFFNTSRQNGECQSSKVEGSSNDAAAVQTNGDEKVLAEASENPANVSSSVQSGNVDILDTLFEKKAV